MAQRSGLLMAVLYYPPQFFTYSPADLLQSVLNSPPSLLTRTESFHRGFPVEFWYITQRVFIYHQIHPSKALIIIFIRGTPQKVVGMGRIFLCSSLAMCVTHITAVVWPSTPTTRPDTSVKADT